MNPTRSGSSTASRILDVSERLLQERGFNGFSYADVAAELSITKASLHYHFASKAELGEALVDRYTTRFMSALDAIEADSPTAPERLQAYADLYTAVLRRERLCLCGMLAAEFTTLPQNLQDAVVAFFDQNEAWLTRVLARGLEAQELQFSGAPSESARLILGALEGSMLVSRPSGNVEGFRAMAGRLISSLAASSS